MQRSGAGLDLPARCVVCNNMQFNRQYGCWKCLQQGKTVKAASGYVQTFPYQVNDPNGPLRNKEDTIRHATKVTQRQMEGEKCSNVMGVKGPSWLSLLEDYDNVRGIAIDYMHGVLLGVQKLLLKLWFNLSFLGKVYSISHLSETLDERLQHITPTLEISRLIPRSITEHLLIGKQMNCDHSSYTVEFHHSTGFCQMPTSITMLFLSMGNST